MPSSGAEVAVECAEAPSGEVVEPEEAPTAADDDELEVFDLDVDLADPDDHAAEGPDAVENGAAEPVAIAGLDTSVATEEGRSASHAVDSADAGGPAELADGATSAGEAEVRDSGWVEQALDLVDAYDLGPESTPEERDRLLSEALAHAEMQDARYRVPIQDRRVARIKGAVALGLFGLAAVLAVAPPRLVRPTDPAAVREIDRREGVAAVLLLQAEQIEAFRVRELRLPASLDELDARLDGVRYVRSDNRLYQLVGYTPQGEAVVYDSSAPSPEFARLEARWLGDGS